MTWFCVGWLCKFSSEGEMRAYLSGPIDFFSISEFDFSPPHILQKMEDVFDGAVGIDLGTTYS